MKNFHRKGFTLIEMLIAITLFAVLVAIAVGGFVNALHTQRQVALLLATQSNVSLALEQIARDVRTGYLFCHDTSGNLTCSCSGVAGPGSTWSCSDLDYFSATSQEVHYRLNNGALEKGVGGNFQSITGDNVFVKYLGFTIFGNTEGDQWNPRITITMGVAPSSTDVGVKNDVLNLQTTISAREIDCSVASSTVDC